MKKILASVALAATLATPAMAGTYTYMCRVNHKSYPVTLRLPLEEQDDFTEKGTITWRGTTFTNVKQGEGCKAEYTATNNGVTIDLCTATQGVADLKIGHATFDCQMPRQR